VYFMFLFPQFIDKFYKEKEDCSKEQKNAAEECTEKKEECKEENKKEDELGKDDTTPEGIVSIYSSGGIRGLVPVVIQKGINPVELVSKMFADDEFPRFTSHFGAHIQRLIPIQRFCVANKSDLLAAAQHLLGHDEAFGGDKPMKYAVVFNKRNNDNLDKQDCIKAIAALVKPHHVVNLTVPDRVILVEAFKSVCGLSLTSEYHGLKKYNIHQQ